MVRRDGSSVVSVALEPTACSSARLELPPEVVSGSVLVASAQFVGARCFDVAAPRFEARPSRRRRRKDEELLGLDLHPHELLFRLFNEDGVRVFHAQPLEMRCRCSEERVQTMLKSFPREEIEDLKVDDKVVVTCEFCGRDYAFTDVQIDGIYCG